MNYCAESGFTRKGLVACPLLLECDRFGRVLWMSERTRLALQNPQHLGEVMVRAQAGASRESPAAPVRFWRVWESRNSVVIGAQPEPETGDPGILPRLQGKFIFHFVRLSALDRRLSASVQRRTGHDGRRAVRQVEMERQRLGRELHTGVGQMLAAIRLQLEFIAVEMPVPKPSVAQALAAISTLAADTLEQVRSISKRLHPPEWQRLGLESAVQQLWEISGVPQRFAATLEIDPLPWEPQLEVKILIYRGLQEALSNLQKHSAATSIAVKLEAREGKLVLSIRDNGVGFDTEQLFSAPANVAAGIGLRSLREMAEELGGKLEVESGGNGTKLEVSVVPFPLES